MVVKINAIEVAEGRGPELEERFAKRAGEVEGMPGFLGYELLRPAKGESRYFVYTRWETEEHFRAWVDSPAFTRGHAQAAKDSRGTVAHGAALMEFEVVQKVEPARAVAALLLALAVALALDREPDQHVRERDQPGDADQHDPAPSGASPPMMIRITPATRIAAGSPILSHAIRRLCAPRRWRPSP